MSQSGTYGIGSGSGFLQTLTGPSGGTIHPDASNNINFTNGTLVSIIGTPATSSIAINVDGAIAASVVTDSGTATPASNILNVLGGTGINTEGSGDTVTINLNSPVSVANGGTGVTSLTDHGVMIGSGTSGVTVTSVGTNGQLLIGATGADPAFASLTSSGGLITYTTGANSLDISIDPNAVVTAVNGWNGSIIETPSVTVASDGATITLSVERSGGGDLTVVFSDGFYAWDTTPADTVTLTAGTDTVPVLNYVYMTQATKTLAVSTSDWPTSEEYAAIATVLCQSAASLQTDGPYKLHSWTDHVVAADDQGHISDINYWIRTQNATWEQGVAPTLTITPNVGTPDNVIFTSTSGIILQLHENTFPAFTGTPDIYVYNDSGTPYTKVTDLNALLTDSTGASMSGRFFTLVIWGVVSSVSGDSKLFCNLPGGSYNSSATLIDDSSGYANYSIPSEFKGTGFLIAALQLRHQTASGGTWTEIDTVDLRGLFPNAVAGGGGASPAEFSDASFRVYDDSDTSKEIAFQASGITTGTTRTLTVQDSDGTIAYLSDIPTGITWNVVTGSTQACAVNNAYFANHNGTLAFTLPSTAAVGDTIQICQMFAGQGFTVAVNTGETIYIGNTNTTTTTGTLASTADGDWIELVCRVANTDWQCNVKSGNITVT